MAAENPASKPTFIQHPLPLTPDRLANRLKALAEKFFDVASAINKDPLQAIHDGKQAGFLMEQAARRGLLNGLHGPQGTIFFMKCGERTPGAELPPIAEPQGIHSMLWEQCVRDLAEQIPNKFDDRQRLLFERFASLELDIPELEDDRRLLVRASSQACDLLVEMIEQATGTREDGTAMAEATKAILTPTEYARHTGVSVPTAQRMPEHERTLANARKQKAEATRAKRAARHGSKPKATKDKAEPPMLAYECIDPNCKHRQPVEGECKHCLRAKVKLVRQRT